MLNYAERERTCCSEMMTELIRQFLLKRSYIYVFTVTLLTLSYIGSVNAYSDQYTVEEVFSEYSNPQSKSKILYYFNGLGAGIDWTNTLFEVQNGASLYCRPKDEALGPEDFFRIWRTEYFRMRDVYDALDSQPSGFILLQGFIHEYPCD